MANNTAICLCFIMVYLFLRSIMLSASCRKDADSNDTVSYIVFLFVIACALTSLHLYILELNALYGLLGARLQELQMIVSGINLCARSGANHLELPWL